MSTDTIIFKRSIEDNDMYSGEVIFDGIFYFEMNAYRFTGEESKQSGFVVILFMDSLIPFKES